MDYNHENRFSVLLKYEDIIVTQFTSAECS